MGIIKPDTYFLCAQADGYGFKKGGKKEPIIVLANSPVDLHYLTSNVSLQLPRGTESPGALVRHTFAQQLQLLSHALPNL